tara:strand:+ start:47258 stop:47845 length:588 start_codon:yes stop_codon:yes gene_type:complete
MLMGNVWCVGISPDDPRLIGIEGVTFHSTVNGCDTLLLATNKNGLNGISALEDNVQIMHESLATATANGLQRMVVLGDTSTLEGRRWKAHAESWNSTMGVSINSIHGMGQLIVEVLARSAALKGMQVILIRVGLASKSDINKHLAHAFIHSSVTLESFKNSNVPDLDAWTALCLDASGEFNSEISSEQWAPSGED